MFFGDSFPWRSTLFPPLLRPAHVDWEPTFTANLNKALEERPTSQHTSLKALLLRWEESDLDDIVGEEIKDLGDELRARFGFDVENWSIPNIHDHANGSTNKLEARLIEFREKYDSRTGLFLIYYGGHGGWDERGGSVWHSSVLP